MILYYIAIMIDLSYAEHQIHCVKNFQDLVSTPFNGEINAFCWTRKLPGDFSEIVEKVVLGKSRIGRRPLGK